MSYIEALKSSFSNWYSQPQHKEALENLTVRTGPGGDLTNGVPTSPSDSVAIIIRGYEAECAPCHPIIKTKQQESKFFRDPTCNTGKMAMILILIQSLFLR